MAGPYETEREALDDVRDIYEEARMSTERGTLQRLSTQRLTDACKAAGVELGEYDRHTVRWLVGFEPQQAQVIVGIVRRARQQRLRCHT
jgi:hypothetical protein